MYVLFQAVTAVVNIPIFCMLRVRGGNDFLYSPAELDAMQTDALLLRAVGRVDGFVFGALTAEGNIDIDACKTIIQVTAPLPVTFHRAIDVCMDPLRALNIIKELGVFWGTVGFIQFRCKYLLIIHTSFCNQVSREFLPVVKKKMLRKEFP